MCALARQNARSDREAPPQGLMFVFSLMDITAYSLPLISVDSLPLISVQSLPLGIIKAKKVNRDRAKRSACYNDEFKNARSHTVTLLQLVCVNPGHSRPQLVIIMNLQCGKPYSYFVTARMRNPGSLKAAGPRPYSGAALGTAQICCA